MINHFKKELLYLGRMYSFRIASKKIDISKYIEREVHVKSSQISVFCLSANTIQIIHLNDKETIFFRECDFHTEKKKYFGDKIDYFFSFINKTQKYDNFQQETKIRTLFSDNEIELFNAFINQCRENKSFYNKISRADIICRGYNFNIWGDSVSLPLEAQEKMGLKGCPKSLYDIMIYFVCYIRGVAWTYRINRFTDKNFIESFSACRSVASYKVAQTLELEKLLVETTVIKVYDENGHEMVGVACKKAEGTRGLDSTTEICPSMQRYLTSLNFLDAICYQFDHYANNYNVVEKEDKNNTIMAFDNDNQLTFWPKGSIRFVSQKKGEPFINKKGLIQRPHLDNEVASRFLKCEEDIIVDSCKEYLNFLQINAFRKRIRKMKKAIICTEKIKQDFLLKKDEWNNDTLEKELNGDYGHTYVWLYANKEY